MRQVYDIYLVMILSGGMKPFNQITGDEPKGVHMHMDYNGCRANVLVHRMTFKIATD